MLCILDLLILYWILVLNNNITKYESSESPICPVYYCDHYNDPNTGYLMPGSLCYTNTTGVDNLMTAYRYNDSGYECQSYLISNNLILENNFY